MRTPTIGPHLTLLMLSFIATANAHAQQPVDVEITGHILEPQRLSPTDARIASLQIPAGFTLSRFAEGLNKPRMLAVAPDGGIYVTQREAGNVVLLCDTDSDGVADLQRVVLRLRQVHGILIEGNEVYLADERHVYRAHRATDGSLHHLRRIARLPAGGQHPNRTLARSPDGELLVSVGSTCNECREPNPEHATLLRVEGDSRPSRKSRIFASGLRNSLAFGWHPTSGRLYAFDNGIDWLGDDAQSEELNEVREGARYGWPYVYDDDRINPHTEPAKLTSQQWARLSEEPVGFYTPHSAPMQMTFYTAAQFPAAYRDNAFAPMRGSWNRKPPSGYEVVRVRFAPNGDFSGFDSFVDGFLQETDSGFGFFGRPVGITTAADGALLIGEEINGMMYRVVHGASASAPPPQRLASQIFTAPRTLRIGSPAIPAGGAIPEKFSDYGAGISPPLRWSNVPDNAVSLVLLMEDPDAVAPLPFVHWAAINLSPERNALPENIRPVFVPLRGGQLRQGSNSISERGYYGPRPPVGDPPHHYHFQLFALDTRLDLPDGFNRHALLKAMEGHVLAQGQFIGTYQKAE